MRFDLAANFRRLALFYYVAHYGGISRAAQRMPCKIQQPALSEQMTALESELHVRLFHRQPFALTPAGAEAYGVLKPIFQECDELLPRLARHDRQINLAVAAALMDTVLPGVLVALHQAQPELSFGVQTGPEDLMAAWLQEGQVDLVLTTREARWPADIRVRRLGSLPLVLLVPHSTPIRDAAEIWEGRVPFGRLIAPGHDDNVGRTFRQGLARGGLRWPAHFHVGSTALTVALVQRGLGMGVTLAVDTLLASPGIRALPLTGFADQTISLCWRSRDHHRVRPLICPLEDALRQSQSLAASN